MPTEHIVGHKNDLQPGDRTTLTAADRFKLDSEFGAINNLCPRHLEVLREGDLTALVTAADVDSETYLHERPGDIVTYPWHDCDFGSKAAEPSFSPHLKTRIYDVERKDTAQNDENPPREKYGIQSAGDGPLVEPYEVEVENISNVLHV
jgi:hypothetical protein